MTGSRALDGGVVVLVVGDVGGGELIEFENCLNDCSRLFVLQLSQLLFVVVGSNVW